MDAIAQVVLAGYSAIRILVGLSVAAIGTMAYALWGLTVATVWAFLSGRVVRLVLLILIVTLAVVPAMSQTGRIPLTDLGPAFYLGQFQGGLYEGGLNVIPADHAVSGAAQVAQIVPRDTSGAPSSTGRILLVSIGMSSTSQEFCSAASEASKRYPHYWPGITNTASTRICTAAHTFTGQAWADPTVEKTTLEVIDGAQSGMTASEWAGTPNPKSGADPWVVLADLITEVGFSKLQVQVAWVKVTNRTASNTPSLPASNADVYTFIMRMGNVVRRAKAEYPNLRILFISSRTYAGWSPPVPPSPEPYAYEQGFGVKWLIQAQVNQMRGGSTDPLIGPVTLISAPWMIWGPYLWADGTTPRFDGLTWPRTDFETDGVHPTVAGEQKVGMWIKDHLKSSPFAMCWFLAGGSCAGAMGTRPQLTLTEETRAV
ncbi:MAG: hypothetical protein ACT4P5_18050 [Armatimonadota bacterium]